MESQTQNSPVNISELLHRLYQWEQSTEKARAESIEDILREAAVVLNAAQKYTPELTEVGLTNDTIHHMRVLITHAAAQCFTFLEKRTNTASVLNELQTSKDSILQMAKVRFGSNSSEFKRFLISE